MKDKSIFIRVTEKELKEIKAAAKKEHKTISGFILSLFYFYQTTKINPDVIRFMNGSTISFKKTNRKNKLK